MLKAIKHGGKDLRIKKKTQHLFVTVSLHFCVCLPKKKTFSRNLVLYSYICLAINRTVYYLCVLC